MGSSQLVGRGWRGSFTDPNSPEALTHRRREVRSTFRGHVRDRAALIESLCRDARVVDIGCVDQLPTGFEPGPLHRRIAAVAHDVVGIDIVGSGVERLNRMGFKAIQSDITRPGLRVSMETGEPNVVVAGEVVEHLADVTVFFQNCANLLPTGGRLVLSSPNPYSLTLCLNNGLGFFADNVDHLTYHSPSGVAELGARHGFQLASWYAVRQVTSRRRLPGFVVGRFLEAFSRYATTGSQTIVYVLERVAISSP